MSPQKWTVKQAWPVYREGQIKTKHNMATFSKSRGTAYLLKEKKKKKKARETDKRFSIFQALETSTWWVKEDTNSCGDQFGFYRLKCSLNTI